MGAETLSRSDAVGGHPAQRLPRVRKLPCRMRQLDFRVRYSINLALTATPGAHDAANRRAVAPVEQLSTTPPIQSAL